MVDFYRLQNYDAVTSLSTVFGKHVYAIRKITQQTCFPAAVITTISVDSSLTFRQQ
jgi:hypothetical protein